MVVKKLFALLLVVGFVASTVGCGTATTPKGATATPTAPAKAP